MASPASLAFASSLGQGFCRSSIVNRRNPSRQSRKRHLVLTTRAADYPTPDLDVPSNRNYQEAKALSKSLSRNKTTVTTPKKVIIVGGGLAGLSCAKYVADAGHVPIVLERGKVLGGKVSAWQDKDGDWIETGLHIFFGAYPNMMNLFKELNIEERLQWKEHAMTFAMAKYPGEFTKFNFPKGLPAPFNMAYAILSNDKMLTPVEKIQTGVPLVPMLLGGQDYIDAQDELSVAQWMTKNGMPESVRTELFIVRSARFPNPGTRCFTSNAGDCSDRLLRLFRPITVTAAHTSSNTRPIHAQHGTDTFRVTIAGDGQGARFHRQRQALHDRDTHRDEPVHQRNARQQNRVSGWQPAGEAVRAYGGALHEAGGGGTCWYVIEKVDR